MPEPSVKGRTLSRSGRTRTQEPRPRGHPPHPPSSFTTRCVHPGMFLAEALTHTVYMTVVPTHTRPLLPSTYVNTHPHIPHAFIHCTRALLHAHTHTRAHTPSLYPLRAPICCVPPGSPSQASACSHLRQATHQQVHTPFRNSPVPVHPPHEVPGSRYPSYTLSCTRACSPAHVGILPQLHCVYLAHLAHPCTHV